MGPNLCAVESMVAWFKTLKVALAVVLALALWGGAEASPPAPTALIALSGDGQITLRWDASPGATSYTMRRRTSVDSGTYSTVASGVTTTTYTDTGRTNGTALFYVVTATNANGTSANSNQARGVPVPTLPANTTVVWPLANSAAPDSDVIRYAFGPRFIGRYDFHAGMDINAPEGTPVYAVMAGEVTNRVVWDGVTTGGGNSILVRHGAMRWTAYLHLHAFAMGVNVGTQVTAGQLLGYVGRTGATSSHLHFTYMVGLTSESANESRSRSPLELLPYTPTAATTASFRENGSNTVDITIPAQANTIRWIILRGAGGVTRVVDYYDVVAQGSTARDTQEQYGLVLNAAAPTIAYPGGGGTVQLWVRPDTNAPWGDFRPTRVTVLDFNGNTLVDRTAYESWKAARGLALNAADSSDADRDGLPLLVEYALDLNPNVASWTGAPQLTQSGDRLELTYRRARGELNYVVEASSDLVTWSPATVTQEWAVNGEMVTAATTLPAGGQRFLRLAVTR